MHSKLLFILFCALFINKITAQDTLGTVGDLIINRHFIETMQIVDPSFAFKKDSASFASMITKAYAIPAEKARRMKYFATDSSALDKELELIKELAIDRYLAYLYDQRQILEKDSFSERDISMYYSDHKSQFLVPARFSYIRAATNDTFINKQNGIIKNIKELAKNKDSQSVSGNKQSVYYIFEKDKSLSQNDYDFQILTNLDNGKYAITPNGEKGATIYFLVNKQAESYKPFDDVRLDCENALIRDMRQRKQDAFIAEVNAHFPILINITGSKK